MNHGLDTDDLVCFYEQEFYPLSNFSSFRLRWVGIDFDTSEAAYHWEKFRGHPEIQGAILSARSAHDAFRISRQSGSLVDGSWRDRRVGVMRAILHAKVDQHEYVHRKLMETRDRRLVENSWRDDFWGWGPDGCGQNQLGLLWTEIRSAIRACRDF